VANKALVAAASDCVSKGEICLSHCLELLGTGDKSMAACSKSVNEMLAVCGALLSLAAQGAPSLSKLASVALDVCKRCETECRKHVHSQCKDCAAACAACAAECKKIAA
jgi:Cys-rich four helix bundle protein (predicted Tat secretion target)